MMLWWYPSTLQAFSQTRKNAQRLGWGLILTLLTSGCALTPQKSQTEYTAAEQSRFIPRLNHWKAEGKIALTFGEERQSASFDWEQYKNTFVLHIYGPFGQGSTWIRRTDHSISLENAELGNYRAPTPEALMQDLVGWQVPISQLQYWIKGMPAPGSPSRVEPSEEGRIGLLEQSGWQVRYARYTTVLPWHLPQKLIIEKEAMRMIVVVKHWQPKRGGLFGL